MWICQTRTSSGTVHLNSSGISPSSRSKDPKLTYNDREEKHCASVKGTVRATTATFSWYAIRFDNIKIPAYFTVTTVFLPLFPHRFCRLSLHSWQLTSPQSAARSYVNTRCLQKSYQNGSTGYLTPSRIESVPSKLKSERKMTRKKRNLLKHFFEQNTFKPTERTWDVA